MSDKVKLVIGLIILAGAVGIGVWQWGVMQDYSARLDAATTQSAQLTIENKKLTESYQEIKADIVDARETAEQALSLVYPVGEDITNFTRLIDNFAAKNNFSSNPFFVSNMSYQNSEVTDEGTHYVPVSMTVTTSSKNFSKFLEYVEDSGSLESEVRLMSIEDMNVTYPEEYGGAYIVRFTIYAYFDGSN